MAPDDAGLASREFTQALIQKCMQQLHQDEHKEEHKEDDQEASYEAQAALVCSKHKNTPPRRRRGVFVSVPRNSLVCYASTMSFLDRFFTQGYERELRSAGSPGDKREPDDEGRNAKPPRGIDRFAR